MMILFITNKEDVTTDILINGFNKDQIPYYRLNTEDLYQNTEMVFDINQGCFELVDRKKSLKINLKEISSVYFRRPKTPELSKALNISPAEKKYLEKESHYLLQGLYTFLEEKFWINDYWAIRKAENKLLQLKEAQKLGFKIPETIITNSLTISTNFLRKHESIIKPIKSGAIEDETKQRTV